MKLSEYHTRHGDRVEWWDPAKQYDLVYKSRVFTDTYSKDTIQVSNADKVIQGGTGYGPGKNLPYEIEHIRPDYFLYPRFLGTAYGFLSRGCPRNCGFCIVSGKEGRRSVQVADLSEFWNGEEEIKLMDPNLLACPHDEASGQIIHNILWMTEQDETRCGERGLQPQLFHNFCLKSDGIRRAKMKGKSALLTADLPFFVIFTSAPNYP